MKKISIMNNQYLDVILDLHIQHNIIEQKETYSIDSIANSILRKSIEYNVTLFDKNFEMIPTTESFNGIELKQQKKDDYVMYISEDVEKDIQFNIDILQTNTISYIKLNNNIFFKIKNIDDNLYATEYMIKNYNFNIHNTYITEYLNSLPTYISEVLFNTYSDLKIQDKINKQIKNNFSSFNLSLVDKYFN